MAKEKINKKDLSKLLPNVEILIVLVFFVSFVFMMLPRCERKQSELEVAAEQAAIPTTAILDSIAPAQPERPKLQLDSPISTAKRTVLYVTIDGMNLRDQPRLSGILIQKMPLFEQVYFMDEITEFTQKLDLFEGYTTDEPWIKVQTKEGRIGWLYGAGVHFYRKKFEYTPSAATSSQEN